MWGSTGRHGSRGGRISLPAGGDSPREPPHQGGLPGASAPPSFIIINVWANSEPAATGPARNERRETNNHSHTPLCLWRLGILFILSQILFLFSVLYLISARQPIHKINRTHTFLHFQHFQHRAAVGTCLGRDLAPFASFYCSITLSFRLHLIQIIDYTVFSISTTSTTYE